MREVRFTLEDNVHKSVKKFGQENDMTMNEAVDHLLKLGLKAAKKDEKESKV